MSLTFMAKFERARGQLLPHPPVAARRRRRPGLRRTDGARACRRSFEHFIAGHAGRRCASSRCFYAPNINSYKRFAPGSFAPTAIAWGLDNRTCALRLVGHGPSLRFENRVPGGDVNPYLAIAAMIAGGLHGIDNELPLEPAFVGNAYASEQPPGSRRRCARPRTCSSAARSPARPSATTSSSTT